MEKITLNRIGKNETPNLIKCDDFSYFGYFSQSRTYFWKLPKSKWFIYETTLITGVIYLKHINLFDWSGDGKNIIRDLIGGNFMYSKEQEKEFRLLLVTYADEIKKKTIRADGTYRGVTTYKVID